MTNVIQFEKTAILEALHALDKKDPKRKVFGSDSHRYRLNPPLPDKVVAAFEKKHRVSLPKDYRYFITVVGNGGAGPYYGLFKFGEHDDLDDYCKWDKGCLIGDLSKPFPHTKAWNLPESFWDEAPAIDDDMPDKEQDRLMEAWDKVLDQKYWNPSLMNGAIPICHEGCAYRQWLVIHGKQKGFIWRDDRAGDGGISPLRDRRRRQVTFSDWYLSWLRAPRRAMD